MSVRTLKPPEDPGRSLRLPVVLQDPATPLTRRGALVDQVPVKVRRPRRGPRSARVEVSLAPWADGVTLEPVRAEDLHPSRNDWRTNPAFRAVHTFTVVQEVLNLYEEEHGLHHDVLLNLADGERILIEPAAGLGANAHYDPVDKCLRFFFGPAPGSREPRYTCMSRDIVAHEAGHAVVDALCPSLADALGPQAHAIHEALADLTAVLVGLRAAEGRGLRLSKLGSLTLIGERLGTRLGRGSALRDLRNTKTLEPGHGPRSVDPLDPHDASQVLSGALVDYLQAFQDSGRRIDLAGLRLFQENVLRVLDYLPPGELGFVDFFLTVLSLWKMRFPGDNSEDRLLNKILADRGVSLDGAGAASADYVYDDLMRQASLREGPGEHGDIWEATDPVAWADAGSSPIRLPRDAEWASEHCSLSIMEARGEDPRHAIARLAWTLEEPNPRELVRDGWPPTRRVIFGATAVVDVFGKLAMEVRSQPPEVHRTARDKMLVKQVRQGRLALPDREGGDMTATAPNGVLRVSGLGRMLHVR